ncbi:ABC transporter ATP-binding protein [Agromyces subbeticus]|uniref:ABC transporter ATP-binding protein n=1 Tax=Agromyces subbeticus TaxID=293890 RepID=UPI00047DAFF9|nr:ABC transporter ATP-binding protein [Agromyces subbeticus]
MRLVIDSVAKSFGSTRVLDDISLDVPDGSRTAIVGASGSGKSTLLRLIAGFEEPDHGRISLGDRVLAGAGGRSMPAHRRGIGYVAQDGALFPHLTVEGNIAFGLRGARDRAARVREAMSLAALDPALAGRFPHQLSGGQQQRVALARALAPRPAVILLDEPFSALDTGLREQTRRAVIEALERSATTAVLVTHDQDEALTFGHGIGIMVDGRLAQSGVPSEVYDSPATPEIAAFLGAAVLLPATLGSGCAECVLGRIPIRHDRSGAGAAGTEVAGTEVAGTVAADSVASLAMVRPAQFELRTDASAPNATVTGIRRIGPITEVHLRLGDTEASTIELRLPHHEVIGLDPGVRVEVRVDGGVVLYPSR